MGSRHDREMSICEVRLGAPSAGPGKDGGAARSGAAPGGNGTSDISHRAWVLASFSFPAIVADLLAGGS